MARNNQKSIQGVKKKVEQVYLVDRMTENVFHHRSADQGFPATIRLEAERLTVVSRAVSNDTFRRSNSSVGGSVASAREAKVSMIKFTQSICTAFNGESYLYMYKLIINKSLVSYINNTSAAESDNDGDNVDGELKLEELGD